MGKSIVSQKQFAVWQWGSKEEHTGQRCAIISNGYNYSISTLLELAAEARKDFPDITDAEIEFAVYDGPGTNRIVGIEFNPGSDHSKVPESYRRVGRYLEAKKF